LTITPPEGNDGTGRDKLSLKKEKDSTGGGGVGRKNGFVGGELREGSKLDFHNSLGPNDGMLLGSREKGTNRKEVRGGGVRYTIVCSKYWKN